MLETEIETRDSAIWIRIAGRLGASESPALTEELAKLHEKEQRPLVFDLGKLEYISSSGLRVFLSIAKRIEAGRDGIAFVGLQDMVRSVFSVSGFDKLFRVCATEEELGDSGTG